MLSMALASPWGLSDAPSSGLEGDGASRDTGLPGALPEGPLNLPRGLRAVQVGRITLIWSHRTSGPRGPSRRPGRRGQGVQSGMPRRRHPRRPRLRALPCPGGTVHSREAPSVLHDSVGVRGVTSVGASSHLGDDRPGHPLSLLARGPPCAGERRSFGDLPRVSVGQLARALPPICAAVLRGAGLSFSFL